MRELTLKFLLCLEGSTLTSVRQLLRIIFSLSRFFRIFELFFAEAQQATQVGMKIYDNYSQAHQAEASRRTHVK